MPAIVALCGVIIHGLGARAVGVGMAACRPSAALAPPSSQLILRCAVSDARAVLASLGTRAKTSLCCTRGAGPFTERSGRASAAPTGCTNADSAIANSTSEPPCRTSITATKRAAGRSHFLQRALIGTTEREVLAAVADVGERRRGYRTARATEGAFRHAAQPGCSRSARAVIAHATRRYVQADEVRAMSQAERIVFFGAFFFVGGLAVWYVAYHPFMAYQREKMARATAAGLRRRRITVVAIIVILTVWGLLLGWFRPSSSTALGQIRTCVMRHDRTRVIAADADVFLLSRRSSRRTSSGVSFWRVGEHEWLGAVRHRHRGCCSALCGE